MKGCRVFKARSATLHLKFYSQNHSVSASNPILNAEDPTSVSSNSATSDDLSQQKNGSDDIQTTSEDVKGGRWQGTGSVKVVKPRELPVSPLMDPEFFEARNRYSAPKPRPSQERTAFQEQLAKNPYALALATPVRRCAATYLPLPSFFLQDFTIMAHPTTSEPWYVPRSLSPGFPSSKSLGKDSSYNPSLGATSYVAIRQSLLQSFFKKATGLQGVYKKFGLLHAKSIARKQVVANTVWRSDMDTFLLELMRRRTAELLIYLCTKDKKYVHECESWERVEHSAQVGCVLWMGQKILLGEKGVQEQEQGQKSEIPPGEFETKRIGPGGRKIVPVFNLRVMMGKHWIEKMREGNDIFRNQILIVKHKNATKEIQMKLWRLQGYVATYGEMPKGKMVKIMALSAILRSVNLGLDRTSSTPKENYK